MQKHIHLWHLKKSRILIWRKIYAGKSKYTGWGYVALVFFLWVSVAIEYQQKIYRTTVRLGNRHLELKIIVLRIVFLVLGFMAAFRGMDVTNDTAAYYRTYQKIAYSGFAGETRMELGYVALNVVLSHIFSDSLVGFHVLLFLTAVFSYLALEQWIERHATTYGICIVAFYFLSNQSFMSAIRQSVAVGFILWALMVWEDLKGWKRYILYIFLVIAATFFHKTAMIAIVFPVLASKRYTHNTTWLIIVITLAMTSTNLVSSIISFLGLGAGYVTAEIGNAVNVGVVSLLYFALLLLRLITANRKGYLSAQSENAGNTVYSDDFYTYCIALSLAVTVMSLRAAGMSRLNMYLQLVGLPYVSNIMNQIEDKRIAILTKVVFSVVIWSYSVIALIYRPEWQHIWPYHFYWQ